jgi:hypothetical protein
MAEGMGIGEGIRTQELEVPQLEEKKGARTLSVFLSNDAFLLQPRRS